jgi:hypothetical protein
VAAWEARFFTYLNDRYGDLMARIEQGYWEEEDIRAMENALKGFRR